jgi:hypothetical protein
MAAQCLDIAPDGWREAWVLRQWLVQRLGIRPDGGTMLILRSMADVRVSHQWLVQGLGIAPNGGTTLISRLMAGTKLGYCANGWHEAYIALDGWCKAWVLRQWLVRGLGIPPDGGAS